MGGNREIDLIVCFRVLPVSPALITIGKYRNDPLSSQLYEISTIGRYLLPLMLEDVGKSTRRLLK